MSPNNTNEELLDVILKQAFTEDAEREIAACEAEAHAYGDVTPTDAQKKAARRAYRSARPARKRGGRRIAASIILAICLGAAAILSVPAVRAALTDSFLKCFDNHLSFGGEEPIHLQGYNLYYLPKGYYLVNSMEAIPFCQYFFQNEDEQELTLQYVLTKSSKIGVDNEQRTIEKVDIFDTVSGYSMVPHDPRETTGLIWESGEYTFMLEGHMSVQKLLTIAKSIVPAEPLESEP